jgi:hypothetical protein
MALKLSTGTKTALAGTEGLKTIFDGGFLDIYTGGQPSSPDYAETGIKLIRISVSSGATGLTFGTAAAGLLPKSADVWSGACILAGVGGYFRFYGTGGTSGSSASERRIDGNVGVSGADLPLTNATLALGATITIDEFTLEVPTSA